MPEIVETQSGQWTFDIMHFCFAFLVLASFAKPLKQSAIRAFYGARCRYLESKRRSGRNFAQCDVRATAGRVLSKKSLRAGFERHREGVWERLKRMGIETRCTRSSLERQVGCAALQALSGEGQGPLASCPRLGWSSNRGGGLGDTGP
jgi:hypothetical protein